MSRRLMLFLLPELLLVIVGAVLIINKRMAVPKPPRPLFEATSVAAPIGTPVSVCEFPINDPRMHTTFRMNLRVLSSVMGQRAYDAARAVKPQFRVWRIAGNSSALPGALKSGQRAIVAAFDVPVTRFTEVTYSVGRDFSFGDTMAVEWVPAMERDLDRDGRLCLTPIASIIDNRNGDPVTLSGFANTIYIGTGCYERFPWPNDCGG